MTLRRRAATKVDTPASKPDEPSNSDAPRPRAVVAEQPLSRNAAETPTAAHSHWPTATAKGAEAKTSHTPDGAVRRLRTTAAAGEHRARLKATKVDMMAVTRCHAPVKRTLTTAGRAPTDGTEEAPTALARTAA